MRARIAIFALAALAACSGSQFASRTAADRPGLGTSWGETRFSQVHSVSFERASGFPFARATLFYDDVDGVAGAAGRIRFSQVGLPVYAGREGRRYRLRVNNRTSRRVEVVASVDGLDVMDGSSASLDKRGYLVEPHETLTIDGFRRSQSEVAAFRFGAVPESYAARTGDDRNVGVIGFAFFDELGAPLPEDERSDELERRRYARPFSDSRYAQPPGM